MARSRAVARSGRAPHTTIAILVKADPECLLIDYPENRERAPVVARSTVALEKKYEGREVAVTFECGDPLRPLIIGLVRNACDPPKSASAYPLLFAGAIRNVTADGRVTAETLDGPVACSVLDSGAGKLNVTVGDPVLIARLPDQPPCVLGVIRDSTSGGTCAWKAGKIIFEAGEEIILKTKRTCLILKAGGDIEVRGERIASRARNLQKLMAPTIKLN